MPYGFVLLGVCVFVCVTMPLFCVAENPLVPAPDVGPGLFGLGWSAHFSGAAATVIPHLSAYGGKEMTISFWVFLIRQPPQGFRVLLTKVLVPTRAAHRGSASIGTATANSLRCVWCQRARNRSAIRASKCGRNREGSKFVSGAHRIASVLFTAVGFYRQENATFQMQSQLRQ